MDKISNIFTNMNFYLTLLSIVLGLFGVFQYFAKRKAEKALKSITWDDMRNASAKISRKLIKKYRPAVIYIPSIKSGIMLQFIRNYFKEYIPVIVGQVISKEYFTESDFEQLKGLQDYWYVNTKKWYACIPKVLLEYQNENILILDNLSLTGNFLNNITDELIKQGISKEHIVTACIATTEAAIADKVAPQYYYKVLTDSKTVYMPWGR